jgi:potassium/chloride transporter 8
LLSDVLGIKFAACIGLFYCFGQAVNVSLTLTAFGESICILFDINSDLTNYISRAIAIVTLLFILGNCLIVVSWIFLLLINKAHFYIKE